MWTISSSDTLLKLYGQVPQWDVLDGLYIGRWFPVLCTTAAASRVGLMMLCIAIMTFVRGTLRCALGNSSPASLLGVGVACYSPTYASRT
jgi:hypothetical protein